jgi:hypothetical protein
LPRLVRHHEQHGPVNGLFARARRKRDVLQQSGILGQEFGNVGERGGFGGALACQVGVAA